MHYAQLELDRIKSNVRPQHLPQHLPNPIEIMESAYHLTTLDAQNEVIRGVKADAKEAALVLRNLNTVVRDFL
jgi:hypothetical protein